MKRFQNVDCVPPPAGGVQSLHLKGELRCVFSGECYRVGRATQTLYSVRGEALTGAYCVALCSWLVVVMDQTKGHKRSTVSARESNITPP